METLKARLISRINYDKKLFMVVLYYKYKLNQPKFLDSSFVICFLPSVLPK